MEQKPELIKSLKSDYFGWLRNQPAIFSFLETLWSGNFRQYGFEYMAKSIFDIIRNSEGKSNETVISEIDNVFTDPSFKKFTRFARQAPDKMDLTYRLIEPELKSISSFLDFGCGRMALIRRIVQDNKSIEQFYGFDPKAAPNYLDFDPRVTFFDTFKDLSSIGNIDLVYSSFVFHHLTKSEIQLSLSEISRLLKPGGKFVLLEETFPEQYYSNLVDSSAQRINRLGYESNTGLLKTFESLSQEEKLITIYLNDVLINLKNLSYMPWTFEYRSMEEWRSLIENFGFTSDNDALFWVAKEGKIKQGISGRLVFMKQ